MRFCFNCILLLCLLPLFVLGQTSSDESTSEKKSARLVLTDQKVQLNGMFTDVPKLNNGELGLPDEQLVVLDFWSIDCGPCLREIPDLNNLANKYSEKVTLVSINNDLLYGKSREEIREIADQYNFNYPVILDTDKTNFMEQFNVYFWPTRYLLNEEGYFYKNPDEDRMKLSFSEIEQFLGNK